MHPGRRWCVQLEGETFVATLKAEKRTGTGKYVAFNLRKTGRIPAVLYGKGMENVNLQVMEKDVLQVLKAGERMVELEIEGKAQTALLKSVQRAVIGPSLVHADFRAVDASTTMHLEVPVELIGEAAGVEKGGLIEQALFTVGVSCVPGNLPEKIVLDISTLDIDHAFYVENLPALPGVTYTVEPDVSVVSCHLPRGEKQAAVVEGEEGMESPESAGGEA